MIKNRRGELWVCCPFCKLSLYQIQKNTKAEHFPIFCRKCRKTVGELNI